MSKKMTRYFDTGTEKAARGKLQDIVNNWSWISRERKNEIVSSAKFEKNDTKYGPVFSVTVPTD